MKDQEPKHPELPGVHIMAVPVISTRHIEAGDGRLLREEGYRFPGILASIGFCTDPDTMTGHLLRISPDPDDIPAEWAEYSQHFRWLLERLQRMGFSYVRLDVDGADLSGEGWPSFEW